MADPVAWGLGICLILFFGNLIRLTWRDRSRLETVEQFVVAGRTFGPWTSAGAMIAVWFGAESLMSTANQVAQQGWSGAMLDPVGFSVCLVLAAATIAPRIWERGLLTAGDLFRQAYGRSVEMVGSWVLAVSYLGWIAAQLVAFATLAEVVFGAPRFVSVFALALLAALLAAIGGLRSQEGSNAFQLGVIFVGLLVLLASALGHAGGEVFSKGIPFHRSGWTEGIAPAVAALLAGALGNLPMQDLVQRIAAARSPRVAQTACLMAAGGYMAIGSIPMLLGELSNDLLAIDASSATDRLTQLSDRLLHPIAQVIFLMAIVATVTSTLIGAILAPASLLGCNLAQPLWERFFKRPMEERVGVAFQRVAIVAMAWMSAWVACGSETIYELLESSYSMGLVGSFVPFVAALYLKNPLPRQAAWGSMAAGIWVWASLQWGPDVGWKSYWLAAPTLGHSMVAELAFDPAVGGVVAALVGFFLPLWLFRRNG
ncbi:MAG: sodium:solute symporter family transporter [Pirellulaceae bacterium]|jgi:Na+/proline symporter